MPTTIDRTWTIVWLTTMAVVATLGIELAMGYISFVQAT